MPLTDVDLLGLPDAGTGRIAGMWPRLIAKALRADLGPVLVFAPRRNAAEELALALGGRAAAGCAAGALARAGDARGQPAGEDAERARGVSPQRDELCAARGDRRAAGQERAPARGRGDDGAGGGNQLQHALGAGDRYALPGGKLRARGAAGRAVANVWPRGKAGPGRERLRALDAAPAAAARWPAAPAQARGLRGLARAYRRDAPRDGAAAIPFAAALEFNRRLFTTQPVPLGVEHSPRDRADAVRPACRCGTGPVRPARRDGDAQQPRRMGTAPGARGLHAGRAAGAGRGTLAAGIAGGERA